MVFPYVGIFVLKCVIRLCHLGSSMDAPFYENLKIWPNFGYKKEKDFAFCSFWVTCKILWYPGMWRSIRWMLRLGLSREAARECSKTTASNTSKSRTGIKKALEIPVLFVPREGLEPSRPCEQQILSLPCLPFHHQGLSEGWLVIGYWLWRWGRQPSITFNL